MKSSDSSRCIRKYQKKDGSFSYHAEIRRKNAKSIRKTCKNLTEAKNWVRSTESSILEGKYVPDNKARKYTLSDLIDKYINTHLRKFPQRLRDQSSHLAWWRENYGNKTLFEITPALLSDAKEKLLDGMMPRSKIQAGIQAKASTVKPMVLLFIILLTAPLRVRLMVKSPSFSG